MSSTLASLPQLESIDFGVSKLTALGDLSGFSKLKELRIRAADLSGSLPSLNGLPSLETVDLASNGYSGPIPDSFISSTVKSLELTANYGLNGTFPANFSNLRDMRIFETWFTGITSPFPDGLTIKSGGTCYVNESDRKRVCRKPGQIIPSECGTLPDCKVAA